MSSISVTQKSKTISILDNRNIGLIILAALVTMLMAVVAVSAASPATQPFDYNAYMLHRQGEWVSVPVSSADAYQIFRSGEVASPVNNAEAYRIFRQGEWAAVPASDLSAYLQSERTLVDPTAGLAIYQLSERTLVDPQAGMVVYHNSERTHIPVRFNKYQRSEWFGE
jgi:hypothetical protein